MMTDMIDSYSTINTPDDVVYVLDKYITPNYPKRITEDLANTKTSCYMLISAYQQMGKIGADLKPDEVENAVNTYLTDRLWVSDEDLARTNLSNLHPKIWLIRPTFFRVFKTIPRIMFEAAYVVTTMLWAAIYYSYVRLKPNRTIKLPLNYSNRTEGRDFTRKDS